VSQRVRIPAALREDATEPPASASSLGSSVGSNQPPEGVAEVAQVAEVPEPASEPEAHPEPQARARVLSGSRAHSGTRRRPSASAPRQLDDLNRQLRILTKVDPWRAFGLGATAGPAQVAKAAERLRERYAAKDSDPPELARILARIQDEVTRIKGELGERHRERERIIRAELDPLLERGCSLLSRNGPLAALQVLETALKANPRSAAHQAWYGWALFQCRNRSLHERAFLALEHLRMAADLGGGPTELPSFIAQVERALCSPDEEAVMGMVVGAADTDGGALFAEATG